MDLFSGSIYGLVQENALLSQKENLMQHHAVQVQPTWPMVSLPSGAASAKKAIQNNLELLQGYEEVVLFFDNDEPGRKAAKECADLLPPGKVPSPF